MGFDIGNKTIFDASYRVDHVIETTINKNTWKHIKEPGYGEYSRNRCFFMSETWGFVVATLNAEMDKELFHQYMESKHG